MVNPQQTPSSWEQLVDDRSSALEQQQHNDQLPAYSEVTKGQSPVEVTEKELRNLQTKQSRTTSGSTMSTLKSILTGDVHKHNPRYVLEESHTGTSSRLQQQRSTSRPKAESRGPASSTMKSILTGDVQRYHPMYRLEESADARNRSRK